jgi:hypothetical protein
MPHVLTTWTSFRHVTLCHVTLRTTPPPPSPSLLPYVTEGCPGGENMGHRPLWDPMPHQPIPEPLGDEGSVPMPITADVVC